MSVSLQRGFPLFGFSLGIRFPLGIGFPLEWVSSLNVILLYFFYVCISPLLAFDLCMVCCSAWFSILHGFQQQMDRLKDGSMEEQIEPLIERQNKFEIL